MTALERAGYFAEDISGDQDFDLLARGDRLGRATTVFIKLTSRSRPRWAFRDCDAYFTS